MESKKLYKGVKVTYYMKNGMVIEDKGLELKNAVYEDDAELLKAINIVKRNFKAVGKEGSMVNGVVTVNTSEVVAARIELIEVR